MPRPDHSVVAINGPTMRMVRRGLEIPPAKLAAEVGVSVEYIRKLELGHSRTVGVKVFDRLCDRLRLTDRRVLLADPHDTDTVTFVMRPHAAPGPAPTLDAPDPVDDALDARDAEDEALDAPDPDDHAATALAESLAS
jgi:transcriptional regulator with XRE-family HTH domain